MERTFKALADGNRRKMLDLIKADPGMTVGNLSAQFEMTRYAVMKHLKVLESADLVLSRKEGRERRLFLNAVPLREIHDRWLSGYAVMWADTLISLKQQMEDKNGNAKN